MGTLFPWICELRERVSGKMLVLVPEGLKRLNVLRNVCPVCSGGENLQQLSIDINAILTSGPVQTDRYSLTQAQRWVLKHFSEGSGDRVRPQNQHQSKLYRQYARLAENTEVRNFRMLTLTGLDKEIIRMEKVQAINTDFI